MHVYVVREVCSGSRSFRLFAGTAPRVEEDVVYLPVLRIRVWLGVVWCGGVCVSAGLKCVGWEPLVLEIQTAYMKTFV